MKKNARKCSQNLLKPKILCNFVPQFRNCIIYRDSNGQEVDILVKEEGQLTAIEVKSSMTYHPDFTKSLQRLPDWTSTPIKRRVVVYGGDFENTAGDIWLLRYDHIEKLFE